MSDAGSPAMPDVRRPDAAAVFVGLHHVPGPATAQTVLERTEEAWRDGPWPAGVLSASCYLSTEGDTVLTYVQCADRDAHRRFTEALSGPAGGGAVEYRVRASVVARGTAGPPACVVVATFDVDGAERQDKVIDNLLTALDGPAAERPPGMLSANFHVSADATRVLNYAEWTSDAAHQAFLDSAAHVTTRRVSGAVPGVRPIGFKRYHLHCGIGR
ncbi:antibiotic biosynthesis monooxygenase family protein [Streptomyces sp. NPDC006435]|uniref:antibiotic biosynthesis monooxygenase family protein n=1 Tax=Streptomyces sp. NPDC006435 TaxID=3154300 RepID=UPI0033B20C40